MNIILLILWAVIIWLIMFKITNDFIKYFVILLIVFFAMWRGSK